MTGPSSSTRAATASYTLTVSEDPRFAETVRALTEKTAEIVGVSAVDAARLALAVERLVDALAARPAAPGGLRLLDVRFDVGPAALRVDIACEPAPAAARKEPGGWTIEHWLAQRGGLDALRELAPDVDLAVDGSPCLCRFTATYEASSRS